MKKTLISLLLLTLGCTTTPKQSQYTQRPEQRYALVVNYDEERFKLQAKKAEQELKTAGYNTWIVSALPSDISDKLEEMGERVGSNDLFMMVWLGHGGQQMRYIDIPRSGFGSIPKGIYSFLATNDINKTMGVGDLSNMVDRHICAKNEVYVFDTCFSEGLSLVGTTTITSSNGFSYSNSSGFATRFLEGINQGDFNGDGITTSGEAFRYAEKKHNIKQNPSIKGDCEVRLR